MALQALCAATLRLRAGLGRRGLMGHIRCSSVVTAVAAIAALVFAVPTTVHSALNLTATVLYMGGTDHPLSIPEDTTAFIDGYVTWAYENYASIPQACAPAEIPVAPRLQCAPGPILAGHRTGRDPLRRVGGPGRSQSGCLLCAACPAP